MGSEKKKKYKSLKKRMKKTFKAVMQSVNEGVLPDDASSLSFIEDSFQMTSYPGYGDEYYGEYNEATKRFQKALDEKDLSALKFALDELKELKSECHDRYK